MGFVVPEDGCGESSIGELGIGLRHVPIFGASATTHDEYSLVGIVLVAFPEAILGMFTEDPALIALGAPLFGIVALMLAADGGQCVMASALRGQNDTWVPTILHTVSYFLIMGPLGYVLAFRSGLGVGGLYIAMFVASMTSVLLLSLRFRMLSRRISKASASGTPTPATRS